MPVNLFRLIDPPPAPVPVPGTVVSGRVAAPDFAGKPRFSTGTTPTPAAPEGGWIETHPRYRAFLTRVGVTTGQAGYDLPGEVVSGHADRHVVRVKLAAKTCYLKREHTTGWRVRLKHRLAGLGPVSRAAREAATLQALEDRRLPGPQWLAHGEDAAGRAFVLVEELPRAAELRTLVGDRTLTPFGRHWLARAAGEAVAELHAAGFPTPDLAAKHLFVNAGDRTVTLIDWPSARVGAVPEPAEVAACLANLHATTPADVTPAERLRFVASYCRARKLRPRDLVAEIVRVAAGRSRKSSVRDQAAPADQRLVWLAGEAVCVVPELVSAWPTPAACSPFYIPAEPGSQAAEILTFPGGLRADLTRRRTLAPLGRCAAALRDRPWRSPGATAGRVLFHLARHGVPGPKLLAFGQRMSGPVTAESFVLTDAPDRRAALTATRKSAVAVGKLLARLHAAGVVLTPGRGPHFDAVAGKPRVASPFAVRLCKSATDGRRVADLRRLFAGQLASLTVGGRAAVVRAYLGDAWADRPARRRFLRSAR